MDDRILDFNHPPTSEVCSKRITVDIVGARCVYLNNFRIAGSKPYVSENLPERSLRLTIRDALAAFSDEEMESFIKERQDRKKYYADCRGERA